MPERPCRQRPARAALLTGLAAVLLLHAGLLAAIEVVPRLRDPFYGDKARRLRQHLRAAPARSLLVVMLGSSRTGVGFDARRCEDALGRARGEPAVVFNFGNPSAGPVTNLLYLRRLLAEGTRPDVALVEVMPPFLAGQRPDPFERGGFATYRLLPGEVDLAAAYGYPAAEIRSDWRLSVYSPWYGLREPLLDRYLPAALPHGRRSNWGRETDECGWNASPQERKTPEEMRIRVGLGHDLYGTTLAALRVGGGPAAALRDLVALCHAEGIRAGLVLMPEGSSYRSWYGPGVEEDLQRYLDGLRSAFAVPVVDARTWVPDEDFSDSHHLLKVGAARFTDRLTGEHLVPWLTPDARRPPEEAHAGD